MRGCCESGASPDSRGCSETLLRTPPCEATAVLCVSVCNDALVLMLVCVCVCDRERERESLYACLGWVLLDEN